MIPFEQSADPKHEGEYRIESPDRKLHDVFRIVKLYDVLRLKTLVRALPLYIIKGLEFYSRIDQIKSRWRNELMDVRTNTTDRPTDRQTDRQTVGSG